MKASGSWQSLMQGVSQQIPEIRLPGQHTEQVNLMPDPIRGLTRRNGTVMQAEALRSYSSTQHNALVADSLSWVSFDYTAAGIDYVVMYRRSARPSNAPQDFVVYDKTNNTFLPFVRPGTDADLDLLLNGGVSAATSIGRYVYMAGNTLPVAQSTTDKWNASSNRGRAVLWVRSGVYSKKYEVTVTNTSGIDTTFSYTTPSSQYTELLDTTGIPLYVNDPDDSFDDMAEAASITLNGAYGQAEILMWQWDPTAMEVFDGTVILTNVYPSNPANATQYSWSPSSPRYVKFHASLVGSQTMRIMYTHIAVLTNPSYNSKVTQLTNAYNQAVTQWIKSSGEAILPENIAEQLRLAAIATGVDLGTVSRTGTHVTFTKVKGIVITDSDDTLIRGVAQEVVAADRLSPKHFVGKTVRVRAAKAEDVFYMVAKATDSETTSGMTDVTWVEGPGVEQAITRGLCMATVQAGTFYMASTATALGALTGLTVPGFIASAAGDTANNPTPYCVGNGITYLGVFQDRLLIGSGGVIRASRSGDYLNWYRTTVLTVPADDALGFLSESSEADELRHGVLYDKSLVLFGKLRQYVIDGRVALTGTSANMPAMSTHSDTVAVAPKAAGNLIYYAKNGELYSSLHQIQPGQNPESPESYSASEQVDSYMTGKAIELLYIPKPNMVLMRTTADRQSVFTFSFVDRPDGRKQAAWHKWQFNAELGAIVGMTAVPTGMLFIFARRVGSNTYLVADFLAPTAELSVRPYFDSMRTLAAVEAGGGSVTTASTGDWKIAIGGTGAHRLLGDTLANRLTFKAQYASDTASMYVGSLQTAYFTPTNPFMQDKNGVTITTGRLTVTKVVTTWQDSSGYEATIAAKDFTDVQENNARYVGDPNNVVGQEVITDFTASVGIGREVREYSLTLAARTWLPFCLSRMEWVGQFFNRTQRL